MKVLHIISNLSPQSGGPTTVVRSLAEYQCRSGLEVTVCTTLLGSATRQTVSNNGLVESWEGQARYLYFSFATPMLLSLPMAAWLRKQISDFDIVHIHGLYRFPGTLAARCARRARVPYLISPHGSLDPFLYRQSRYNLALKRAYERLFDIPALNHAAAIHYTSEDEEIRTRFLGLSAQPVVVPIGVDWERYEGLPEKGGFRRRLDLTKANRLVLFLGRINFKKGLNLLIPAFARVLEGFPDARLAVVGPDNEGYRSKVRGWCAEQGIEEEVLFVDHLGREEVTKAYVDADVFVLPSYTENFGLTVVEAMACGCPVIISDQVNIWREVLNGGAGVVVALQTNEIAQAICSLLARGEEAKKMGARGRLVAKTHYAWHGIIDQFTQVYRELIQEGPRFSYERE